jgi:hypothetical protein
MAGHVSKASDVYAFGVLLFEIVTGRRAYAGVPIPLLPHEVAVRGLRPEWPEGLPPECEPIRKLAAACWAQEPQSRCVLKMTYIWILSRYLFWVAIFGNGGAACWAQEPQSRCVADMCRALIFREWGAGCLGPGATEEVCWNRTS